jgi:uncharacterized protein YabE (DUF348 family)
VGKVSRKSIYLLTAAASVALAGGATAAGLYKKITLVVDDKKEEVSGFKFGTVGDLLRQKGIQVKDQDLVQPTRNTHLQNGLQVVVIHAKEVSLQDGNQEKKNIITHAETVEDLLKELNVKLGEADKINVDLKSDLKPGQTITITRRNEQVIVAEEKVPFQTERQPDDDSYKGQEKELTPGVEGLARITTKVIYENGQEVDRQVTRDVVKAPVNRVIAYGTKSRPLAVASRSGENFQASQMLTMTATAYSSPGGRTASGLPAQKGVVAVDPNVIPLGTKLYIPGYGYAVAADVGGAIKGNRIDLAFDSNEEAVSYGRRTVTVYIVP